MSGDVKSFRSLGLPYDTNSLRERAKTREVPELYHVHTTGFSDGEDVIPQLVEEAARMGVKYLGLSDHGRGFKDPDFGGKGYYGEEVFSDPETMAMALEDYLESESNPDLTLGESFDVHLAHGMEMDYHPDYEEEIIDYVGSHDFDYLILSVHHNREGRNFGRASHFPRSVDSEQTVEDYFNLADQAIDFGDRLDKYVPGKVVLGHIDRIEKYFGEKVKSELGDFSWKARYERVLDRADNSSIIPEYNPKISLRNFLLKKYPTVGSEALRNHGTPFAGGTDTHRVGSSGKVDYSLTESERRLQELEAIAEESEQMETVLTELDLPCVRLPASSITASRFH